MVLCFFSIRKSLETPTLSLEYFLYRLQCKTPVYFLLKPLAFEGAFQAFSILVYECSLGPKVLIMIIEILREKWCKQNLGTDYNITTLIRYRCTLPAYIRFKGVYYMQISEFPRTVNFLIWENEHIMTLNICHYRYKSCFSAMYYRYFLCWASDTIFFLRVQVITEDDVYMFWFFRTGHAPSTRTCSVW